MEGVDDIDRATVPELRAELRRRGLSALGRKAELIERLRSSVRNPPPTASRSLQALA